MVLTEKNIFKKIENCELAVQAALENRGEAVPSLIGRDVAVLQPGELPKKDGISKKSGQARLLHDLASIELQAMELGLRSLLEYPEAPREFREELAGIVLSENRHLQLCLRGIQDLGFQWGDWPVHTGLWQSVDVSDSLLDRILIVHRYLEGSGLDAGETFQRRLGGVDEKILSPIVNLIFTEEIEHVYFGSKWYREVCALEKIDPNQDFVSRMNSIKHKVPKRIEPVAREARLKAGFTEEEIRYLEELRESIVKHSKRPRLVPKSATGPRAASQA